MTSDSAAQILATLKEHDRTAGELSILRISEPISSKTEQSPSKRNSDASNDAYDNPTPTSLEADLTHYKELFSKLRFSYIEQVTKEKFLRAIVGDPPLVVGHNENIELEAQLAQVKQELKARKEEVRVMIEEMERVGRDLASRYKKVQLQTTQLSELPASIENLESTISKLRASSQASQTASNHGSGASPYQNLSLPSTVKLLAEREAELANLDRQLNTLNATLPRKTREAETIERELAGLERKKTEAVAQAKEAQRRKEDGESDGLEEMGRWYRGAEAVLRELVPAGN